MAQFRPSHHRRIHQIHRRISDRALSGLQRGSSRNPAEKSSGLGKVGSIKLARLCRAVCNSVAFGTSESMNHRFLSSLLIVLSITIVASAAEGDGVKLTKEDNRITVEIAGQPFGITTTPPKAAVRTLAPSSGPCALRWHHRQQRPIPTRPRPGREGGPSASPLPLGRAWRCERGGSLVTPQGRDTPKQRHLGFAKVEGDTIVENLAWEDKSISRF